MALTLLVVNNLSHLPFFSSSCTVQTSTWMTLKILNQSSLNGIGFGPDFSKLSLCALVAEFQCVRSHLYLLVNTENNLKSPGNDNENRKSNFTADLQQNL